MQGEEGESTDADSKEKKDDDGIGIPHLLIDCADKTIDPGDKIFNTGRLPTVEQVNSSVSWKS